VLDEWISKIHNGDCVEVLKSIPNDSIDYVVTDPPYGIAFMGKLWDKALPDIEAFKQMYRVLKPGALAFVMSSPRQDVLWRMLRMLEECGFQLRQSFVSWIYKTGFPKAYCVSKGIDRKFKLKRKTIGVKSDPRYRYGYEHSTKGEEAGHKYGKYKETDGQKVGAITEPVCEGSKKWQGWKSITGLKPALECILMVNKPLSEKTIVDNVLKHGTGAINVDACRIPCNWKTDPTKRGWQGRHSKTVGATENFGVTGDKALLSKPNIQGRFPSNLLVSDKALDTGKITKSKKVKGSSLPPTGSKGIYNLYDVLPTERGYNDTGDQSRYFDLDAWAEHHGFLDVPKASKQERNDGLEDLTIKEKRTMGNFGDQSLHKCSNGAHRTKGTGVSKQQNVHPTVKPIKLMAYLIELGCHKDGIVLDPFVGSGTTCIAAQRLNRKWIGIELNEEYCKIASARLGNVPIVKHESSKKVITSVKKIVKSTGAKCSYEGNCSFKTEQGECLNKRFCNSKVI